MFIFALQVVSHCQWSVKENKYLIRGEAFSDEMLLSLKWQNDTGGKLANRWQSPNLENT